MQTVSALPLGTALARYINALVRAKGSLTACEEIAKGMLDTPGVYYAAKGVVEAVSTGASTGAPLVEYGIARELITLTNRESIYGQCLARMRRVPFRIRTPKETAAAGSGWIERGGAIPATSASLDTLLLEPFLHGAIIVYTRELAEATGPAAEAAVRTLVTEAVAASIDSAFLDPSIDAVEGQRPASITNGAANIPSTGATAAALTTDTGDAMDLVTTEFRAPVWFMRPSVWKKMVRMTNAAGAEAFPGLRDLKLHGVPVLLGNVPQTTGSPGGGDMIVIADLSQIAYSDDGEADIQLAKSATISMKTDPSQPEAQVSLFQTNAMGIRLVRTLSWTKVRSDAVAFVDGVNL